MMNTRLRPIIYLRGYAGSQGGVEATVDDPFYGFNVGSTHVRVGDEGKAQFFAFESPLVRLMSDHGYEDVYEGGQEELQHLTRLLDAGRGSIFIYRYYDVTSETFDREAPSLRLEIEQAAEGLRELIAQIREQLQSAPGGSLPDDKVNLIGHSTGGLIIRSLLQKIYPQNKEKGADYVNKVFTYATPHGGIHFDIPGGGLLARARDALGRNNMDDFGADRMWQYTTPGKKTGRAPEGFEPRSLGGAFPEGRFFCLVGTNSRDYEVAAGWSRRLVGVQSDGLVQINQAYVKGAPRAYVHRAHSGRYGIVNSEEGYRNLERFFFGDVRVELMLDNLDALRDRAGDDSVTHQAEVQVAIRQLPVLLHDQQLAHHSQVLLERERLKQGEPVPLFTAFLLTAEAPEGNPARYAVKLAVHQVRQVDGMVSFLDHLEQMALWQDQLIVDVPDDVTEGVPFTWSSSQPDISGELKELGRVRPASEGDSQELRVALPEAARKVLGREADLVMRISRW